MVPFASWSVLTTDFLIVLYLTLGGATFAAILQLSGARWQAEVRTVSLALFALFPLALVLLVILLAAGATTFPWVGLEEHAGGWSTYTLLPQAGGTSTVQLPTWHNYRFLVVRQLAGFLLVSLLHWRYIQFKAGGDQSTANKARTRQIAYWILVVYVLYGTMVAWDFEMTLLPEWHSAIFGMYHFVSNFGMFISFIAVLMCFLRSSVTLARPIPDLAFDYLAQMMLAFSMLWMYTFFSQYLTIWYGNIPHEANRVNEMEVGDYSVLWWSFIVLKFVIPFSMLIFDYVRHSPILVVIIGWGIILGTWMESYTWISASHPAGPFQPGYMPMSSFFDILSTVAILLAGFVLIRRALLRSAVAGV